MWSQLSFSQAICGFTPWVSPPDVSKLWDSRAWGKTALYFRQGASFPIQREKEFIEISNSREDLGGNLPTFSHVEHGTEGLST